MFARLLVRLAAGRTDNVRQVSESHLVDASDAAPRGATSPQASSGARVDLASIERDLSAVEAALPLLDDGSYWRDETTGEPIPDHVLAENPVARRARP